MTTLTPGCGQVCMQDCQYKQVREATSMQEGLKRKGKEGVCGISR